MTSFIAGRPGGIRVDLLVIASLIESGTRVLDIGCGDGALLEHLTRTKSVDGRGLEIFQAGVNACVGRGLSVIQGDADTDLKDYPDLAFDYVVLSQTLQATRNPRTILEQLVRIGRHAIITIPNFGYWRIRLSLLFSGRMPDTDLLSHPWYASPNIHLCTIRDLLILCREIGLVIERSHFLDSKGQMTHFRNFGSFANWFSEQGLFVLRRA
ncbi:MAG: methionine biosynthesis protein MetW [Alphaproteobacteria bacterium]|nr:methionine biosynthesis protein MetW [Alphaproteobacteria bacterium]